MDYFKQNQGSGISSIYTLLVGGNDYYFNPDIDPEIVVNSIIDSAATIIQQV